MFMLTRAAASPPNNPQQPQPQDRRAKIEQARKLSVKRIQDDLKLIAKRETDFAKALIKGIVPMRVKVNDSFLKNLPITVEMVDDEMDGEGDGEDGAGPGEKKEIIDM